MVFDFNDPIPLVQKKKKYASFKITPIGGPDEIKKWREMQEARATTYRMRLGERDNRLNDFEKKLAQSLDRGKVKGATWSEKVLDVKAERKRLRERQAKVVEYKPTPMHTEAKKPILSRVAGFFKRLWSEANF